MDLNQVLSEAIPIVALLVPIVSTTAYLLTRWSVLARARIIHRLEDTSPTFRTICRLFGGRPEFVSNRSVAIRVALTTALAAALLLPYAAYPPIAPWLASADLVTLGALVYVESRLFRSAKAAIEHASDLNSDQPGVSRLLGQHFYVGMVACVVSYAGFFAPLSETLVFPWVLWYGIVEYGLGLTLWMFIASFLDSRVRLYDRAYTQLVSSSGEKPVRAEIAWRGGNDSRWSGQIVRVRSRLAILTDAGLLTQLEWADVGPIAVAPAPKDLTTRLKPLSLVKFADESPDSSDEGNTRSHAAFQIEMR